MTTVVSQWRIYCNTESAWVMNWSVAPPTTCINNTAHTVNLSSQQVLQTLDNQMVQVVDTYVDPLQSSRIVQQLPIIDLKSFHGIGIRNQINTVGTGAISATSEVDSEFQLSVGGASDVAGIRSAKRGYYIAGMVSEVGIAIRVPVTLASSQILKFGYFDNNNGYYFKLVGGTLNIGVMYNGVETLVSNSLFNRNRFDGSEANGITLDWTKGNIFRIEFTWYGFGQIIFGAIQTDITNTQKFFPMHCYNSASTTTCANPYQPINVQLTSNGSTLSRNVYLAGRQYSIIGNSINNVYRNMFHISNVSSSNSNANPIFSLQYRTGFLTCPSEIKQLRALSNVNAKFQILKNATLIGASFGLNPYVQESCLNVDTSATFTGGNVLKTYLLYANIPFDIELYDCDIYETDTITFTWQTTTSTNTISLEVQWDERW
jgi:hypothetical protein